MRIRLAVPDELDDQDRKAALDAALESVTRTNTGMIRTGKVPPAAKMIKAGKVVWKPEPPGDEHFDLPGTIIGRGWGDCDDLAPWHAASLRAAGIDPKARAFVKKSGPRRWHALVRRGDGSIEDPSLAAGMHSVSGLDNVVLGSAGSIHTPMSADGRLCLAICPSRDPRHPSIWFARCDVPDRLEPWDWSSMAASSHPAKALLRSVQTARKVAGADMDPDDEARLAAVNDLVLGADPEEVASALHEVMGEGFDLDGCMEDAVHSVGFFGKILKAAVSPLTSTVKFVKNPSLKNAAGILTAPVTSHFEAAKAVAANPIVNKAIQYGLPIAATAFGGPLGTMAGGALGQLLARAAAGSAARGGAPGLPVGLPGIPGLPPELAQLASQLAAQPRFQYEAGRVVRPWGANGPSVLRF